MSRIGLALAGGGPEGAVYEIGALWALQEALEGIDFNRLPVYVGVSAGSVIAALVANGLTPAQLVRAMVRHDPGEHPFDPVRFFTPAYGELLRRGRMLPRLFAEALWSYLRHPRDQRLSESLTRLARALPVGVFNNAPIRQYLARTFSLKGRSDDFRRLKARLVVIAADLESGRPVRFGHKGWMHVPISVAVQASTAVPGVYPPVEVDGRYCVDGVLLKTLHASVALDEKADLLFCVNPLVPADTRDNVAGPGLPHGALVERGFPTVFSQTFRTLIHSRLEVGMAAYETRYPHADVLLFEPEPDEYQMFFTNVFSFSSRRRVCELAYQATRRDLWRRRRTLGPLLARHGIRLRLDVLRDRERDLWAEVGLTRAGRALPVTRKLDRALAALEQSLPP